MTQPRLVAQFQPLAAEGRGGMERVWHQGEATAVDVTPFVLGMPAAEVVSLHAEASRSHGADLDFVADAIPGFVSANTGEGGFDLLLDGDEIDAFFAEHGLAVATLTDADLERLRSDYGTEIGAAPFVVGDEPAAGPSPR